MLQKETDWETKNNPRPLGAGGHIPWPSVGPNDRFRAGQKPRRTGCATIGLLVTLAWRTRFSKHRRPSLKLDAPNGIEHNVESTILSNWSARKRINLHLLFYIIILFIFLNLINLTMNSNLLSYRLLGSLWKLDKSFELSNPNSASNVLVIVI